MRVVALRRVLGEVGRAVAVLLQVRRDGLVDEVGCLVEQVADGGAAEDVARGGLGGRRGVVVGGPGRGRAVRVLRCVVGEALLCRGRGPRREGRRGGVALRPIDIGRLGDGGLRAVGVLLRRRVVLVLVLVLDADVCGRIGV